MGDHRFTEQLRTVEGLLTGQDPAPGQHLVTVRLGDQFHAGTTVRPLQQVMHQLPSGLFVPPGVLRERTLLAHARVYLTAEEILETRVEPATLAGWFSQMTTQQAVTFAAYWIAKSEQPGSDRHDVDAEFLEYFREPHRTRIANLLRDRKRALVVPQALMFLARAGLLHCPELEPDDVLAGDLGPLLATLGVTDYLSANLDEDSSSVVTQVPGGIGRELIANQLFNAREDLRTTWATFQRCWRELPDELAEDPRMQVNVPEEFRRATGVDLDDVVLATALLAARVMVHARPTIPLSYLDELGWSQERLEAVLTLFAATPQQMRQMLADEGEKFSGNWSTRTFDQYPVVRWADSLTVLSPRKLARRAAGLWPMHDILRELEQQSDSTTLIGRVRSTVAFSYEVWVLEAFAGIVGDRQRFYDEHALKHAYPRSKVADAALDYGDAWVVVEITTPGLKAATAAGIEDAAVVQDINNCVKKAQQLDKVIQNLRANEAALTGAQPAGPRRFYPVLVIADRFATNPILMTLLWERLDELGVLQGQDVAPLEVLELEDLDTLEGLIEEGGPDLVTILREKAEDPTFRGAAMQQYVVWGREANPEPPSRVTQRWSVWIDLARRARPAA